MRNALPCRRLKSAIKSCLCTPLGTLQAQDIVRTLEQEAKAVELNLPRVGYMNFSEKVGRALLAQWLRARALCAITALGRVSSSGG